MRKALFVMAMLVSTAQAETTVGLHLGSVHLPSYSWQNDVNPGAYIRIDGWTAGAYYNTYKRPSVYAGYTFVNGPFSVTVGAVSGYRIKQHAGACMDGTYGTTAQPCNEGAVHGALAPLVVPSVLFFDNVRVSLLPGVPGNKQSYTAVHLSIEKSFK
jgi:hypothetical protein